MMSKKSRKHSSDPLPQAEDFAARHGIRLETASAILATFGTPHKSLDSASTDEAMQRAEPRRIVDA
jgi:hypothetical protein